MASYGTRQQWQQQQPPPQRQYQQEQRPDPRTYQQGPPPVQRNPPPQRHDLYDQYAAQQTAYQNGYNGYDQYDQPQHQQQQPRQHQQQDYYQGQQQQEQRNYNQQYQEPYAQKDPYDQSQSHGRTYQYDERYHANAQTRQQRPQQQPVPPQQPVNSQPHPHYQQDTQRQPGKQRPPPLQEQRQKRKIPLPLPPHSAPLPCPYPYHHPNSPRPRPRPQPPYSPNHMRSRSNSHPAPRDRILLQPTSPKVLAWDNPFGAFPPKKKEKDPQKHASLDKVVGGLGAPQGSHPDQRPHTSHEHRRHDNSRPNTSQGHRAESRPLDSPRLPREGQTNGHRTDTRPLDGPRLPQDDMPLRKAIPMPQGLEKTNGPPRPPVNALPSRPAPQRALTQPAPTGAGSFQLGPVDPYAYDDQNMSVKNQPRPPSVEEKPPPVVRQNTDNAYGRRPQPETYDDSTYRGVPLYKPTSSQSAHTSSLQSSPPQSRQANLDIPNFDAIPNALDETHMSPSTQLQPKEQPAYAKKSYQAYSTLPAVDTANTNPAPREPTTASPLADFSFGLPSNRARPPASIKSPPPQASIPQSMASPVTYDNPPKPHPTVNRYDNFSVASPAAGPYDQQSPYENRIQPVRQQVPSLEQVQPSSSQFPPRGASRPGPQPRAASDAHANPVPNQGAFLGGPGQMPPRPATSQDAHRGPDGYGAASVRNGYDQNYGQQQTRGQNYDQQMPPTRGQYYDEGDPYSSGQYGQDYDPRAPIQRPPPQDQYGGPSPPRPQTSGSRHPPPVRNYGERSSLDQGRPDMPPPISGGFGDRPVPYRPGLAAANVRTPSPVIAAAHAPVPQPQPQQAPPPMRSAPVAAQGAPTSSPVTVAELNNLREGFKNKPDDWGLGLKFAERLVEAASVLSNENGRADPKTTAKNRERYILDSHKVLKRLVASGSPEAMFYLADCHGQGKLGLAPDPKEAFALYQSAAKVNHPQSAYRVAVCCEIGLEEGGGTRRDPMKAVQWYKRAATLGDTPAMYKLGMVLLKGLLGQQKSPREAVSWLKRAAERADKDNPHALHELGLLYESASPTDHIVRDERYAFSLFQQAADLGYKYSQFRLGSAWEYGLLGCQIDSRQSIAWYTRAAAQSEHQSELALSGWYLTGSEPLLQQSDQEAYLWARKAASSGLAKAEYAMGYFTEVGIGTKSDVEEAKRWYYRAAAQSFPKARERLEELKRGAQKQKRTRVSRTGRSEGDCVVM